MGNGTSRVVGCFVPFSRKNGVDLEFLEPLDEGLGHSFCYVRPSISDSPAITPSNSERFTVDSSTLDSETLSGSFRHENIDDPSGLHRQNKSFPEPTFKTISGASVSANVSTARTSDQSALFASEFQEPAASFESTSSFAAIPLQPVPRGSGPLNGFLSGPLERGFESGPLERGSGFMSGPIEKGVMSGPLDATDKSNFSAPLANGRRKPHFHRLMRSVSGPVKSTLSRTFSKHSMGSSWMQRFCHPITQLAWNVRELKSRMEASRDSIDGGPSQGEYVDNCNFQWAHGKAGEDRIHVVLSEEQGWLFIGIYDGFSGPDAPDFLMSHLYRAMDKELEGLLWDYADNFLSDPTKSELSVSGSVDASLQSKKEDQPDSSQLSFLSPEDSHNPGTITARNYNNRVLEENDDIKNAQREVLGNERLTISGNERPTISGTFFSVPTDNLTGNGGKTMRLYELLRIESSDGVRSVSTSLDSEQASLEPKLGLCTLIDSNGDASNLRGGDPSTSREDGGAGLDAHNRGSVGNIPISMEGQNTRKSTFSSKIRKMFQKQKSLWKKLFPWSYDWHRQEACGDEVVEHSGPMRRCKSGIVDHDTVLRAMTRALERTEEEYMEMVEMALDKNPELALMGSCVLVMLMKDQDVYVMNLGDSRAILAQERPSDRCSNISSAKDDTRYRNRSGESLVRMELDRISEESPMHNHSSQINMINKNREISFCRLKMRAVQLSTDHSTCVEEEVCRVKAEHPDDYQAILNDRVKGQLKVTRAFGAGFLKKPTCNDALLEMFRINYVGANPYLGCIPFVLHHRLSSCDRFLVLSSDGLYQYFSNEEVVAHVTWFMENVPEGDPAQYLIAELLFRAAKKNGMDFHELLDIPHGDRRKYHDDVSVMVVSLEGRIWRSSS